MKVRALILVVAVMCALLLGGMANAHYGKVACNLPSASITRIPPAPAPAYVVYIDPRPAIWIYVESNGHFDYQHGGLHPILEDADADPCFNWKTCPPECPVLKTGDTLIL